MRFRSNCLLFIRAHLDYLDRKTRIDPEGQTPPRNVKMALFCCTARQFLTVVCVPPAFRAVSASMVGAAGIEQALLKK
jgi:hypothetical protein